MYNSHNNNDDINNTKFTYSDNYQPDGRLSHIQTAKSRLSPEHYPRDRDRCI